jgi:dCMP deaminase
VNHRPSWADYFLTIADAVSRRGDCTRRQVGAVLVGEDHRIIETGYNGAPSGKPGCLSAGACPRGRHYKVPERLLDYPDDICACGNKWPCSEAVPPGSSYDTGPGMCIATHAELNALLLAGIRSRGAVMYVSEPPCDGCKKSMEAAGVACAMWWDGHISFTEDEKPWWRRTLKV